jgi:hypothetical protein
MRTMANEPWLLNPYLPDRLIPTGPPMPIPPDPLLALRAACATGGIPAVRAYTAALASAVTMPRLWANGDPCDAWPAGLGYALRGSARADPAGSASRDATALSGTGPTAGGSAAGGASRDATALAGAGLAPRDGRTSAGFELTMAYAMLAAELAHDAAARSGPAPASRDATALAGAGFGQAAAAARHAAAAREQYAARDTWPAATMTLTRESAAILQCHAAAAQLQARSADAGGPSRDGAGARAASREARDAVPTMLALIEDYAAIAAGAANARSGAIAYAIEQQAYWTARAALVAEPLSVRTVRCGLAAAAAVGAAGAGSREISDTLRASLERITAALNTRLAEALTLAMRRGESTTPSSREAAPAQAPSREAALADRAAVFPLLESRGPAAGGDGGAAEGGRVPHETLDLLPEGDAWWLAHPPAAAAQVAPARALVLALPVPIPPAGGDVSLLADLLAGVIPAGSAERTTARMYELVALRAVAVDRARRLAYGRAATVGSTRDVVTLKETLEWTERHINA